MTAMLRSYSDSRVALGRRGWVWVWVWGGLGGGAGMEREWKSLQAFLVAGLLAITITASQIDASGLEPGG